MINLMMIQISKNRWKIETNGGIVLIDDIYVANKYEATEYAKAYISSQQGWDFELKPLGGESEHDKDGKHK